MRLFVYRVSCVCVCACEVSEFAPTRHGHNERDTETLSVYASLFVSLYPSAVILHAVSQKNAPDIFSCNLSKHLPI